LGAIWEIGALVALEEALVGIELTDLDVYVGVSSGSFIAAGLANGISPRTMHSMFIESESADDPFEPSVLLRPALQEFLQRLALLPGLLTEAAGRYLESPSSGFFKAFQGLARALPTGVFDNVGVGDYLARLFSTGGRTNDFRYLRHKLFVVATDLDSGELVPFGARGWSDVPINRAVLASAALPGLFPPVEIRGRYYVDGALLKTLHASVGLRAGAELLLCINPLVPFNADLAAERSHKKRFPLVQGGLAVVLAQTFRAIIHSRMKVGMSRYRREFPNADVLLFQPESDDAEMFFSNVFSYSARRRLSEHAYRKTRAELRHRLRTIAPALARHGVRLDMAVLADESRTLARPLNAMSSPQATALGRAARQLDRTLDNLDALLRHHST
jgi:predicted acylesterase/phospholipase RssA